MHSLDKINFKKFDPENFCSHLDNFPILFRNAWQKAENFSLPSYYIKANKFVLLGMGGSGIAGDIIKDLVGKNVIIESIHNYEIPKWVDKDTIVIASSYSGNTEEPLSAFFDAYDKKARLIVITSGGRLKRFATKFEAPCFSIDYASPPRAAFPYLFAYLLSIFCKLGHYKFDEREVNYTTSYLSDLLLKIKPESKYNNNLAKILAQKIYGRIPIFYGGGNLESVARRLKSDINETSKSFAGSDVYPELNHNAIEGIISPKNSVSVVSLESAFDNKRVILRQNITSEIYKNKRIPFERIKFVPCDNEVAEICSFVMFGGFLSYYLAILNQKNPSENKQIDYLKESLSK